MLNMTIKFKCVVQVVVTKPCQVENLLSHIEKYKMQLTQDDF